MLLVKILKYTVISLRTVCVVHFGVSVEMCVCSCFIFSFPHTTPHHTDHKGLSHILIWSLQNERGADCYSVSIGAEGSILSAHTRGHPPWHQERLHSPDQWWQGKYTWWRVCKLNAATHVPVTANFNTHIHWPSSGECQSCLLSTASARNSSSSITIRAPVIKSCLMPLNELIRHD